MNFGRLNIRVMNFYSNPNTSRFQQKGYTLFEIIAVLAILAILTSFSIPKLIQIDASAEREVIKTAIKELNYRELLEWQKIRLSDKGWEDDTLFFQNMNYDLKPNFSWSPEAQADGGVLLFKSHIIKMKRTASTSDSPGKWAIIFS